MIFAVYIAPWKVVAVFCVVCWLAGARADARKLAGFVRSIRARRAHRRKLNELWRDEVGADRGVAVPSARGPVATTAAVGVDDPLGGAA